MENYRLQDKANGISGIIDELIAEIENLESDLQGADEKIKDLEMEIIDLKEQIKELQTS